MNVSLILTVNNRPPEVSKAVADSLKLPGNQADELIVVLDRTTDEAVKGTDAYMELDMDVKSIVLHGEPGWKGPAVAWNAGIKAAKGELLYCFSSEVVQDKGNVEKAAKLCANMQTVLFGACDNSTPVNLVVGAPPGLLVSSKMPRPLGFIVAMPSWAVNLIGGYDEEFTRRGYWFDDDDFFFRLWRTGVDFMFDDSVHGIHLDHARPGLETPEGQAGIKRNEAYMLEKHGVLRPLTDVLRTQEFSDGRVVWRHP